MSASAIVAPITRRARSGRNRTAGTRRQFAAQFGDLGRPRRAAGAGQQQLGGALDGALLQRRIDAALEALRGVGDEAVATAAAGDRLRLEEGHFEQHVGRVGADARCARRP